MNKVTLEIREGKLRPIYNGEIIDQRYNLLFELDIALGNLPPSPSRGDDGTINIEDAVGYVFINIEDRRQRCMTPQSEYRDVLQQLKAEVLKFYHNYKTDPTEYHLDYMLEAAKRNNVKSVYLDMFYEGKISRNDLKTCFLRGSCSTIDPSIFSDPTPKGFAVPPAPEAPAEPECQISKEIYGKESK